MDWWLDTLAKIATIVGLPATTAALLYVIRQFKLGRLTASAGSLIALQESLRQSWIRYTETLQIEAPPALNEAHNQRLLHSFADLANLLESSCALFEDNVFFWKSGELFEKYLLAIFGLINASADAKKRLELLIHSEDTFAHITAFIASHRAAIHAATANWET